MRHVAQSTPQRSRWAGRSLLTSLLALALLLPGLPALADVDPPPDDAPVAEQLREAVEDTAEVGEPAAEEEVDAQPASPQAEAPEPDAGSDAEVSPGQEAPAEEPSEDEPRAPDTVRDAESAALAQADELETAIGPSRCSACRSARRRPGRRS